ncbi:hypothetical protein [Paracoccus yeei]|uniref:Uncharacterized protein n=1 Tax=Paracoccus yeei TaxID=147645 RepID=A0A5P2QS35_9RHOB|nr:hypothetical protein [Paracoccus yeei]QEU08196.1 hypothetical protein FOB51_09390 [Paracoccus yeei]
MADQNNAPEMPDRIWAFEDYPGQGAVPRGGWWCDEQSESPEGSIEYVRKDLTRADRAGPEGQVVDLRMHLGRMLMAQDGVPLNAIEFGKWVDEARAAYSALTPPPATPEGQVWNDKIAANCNQIAQYADMMRTDKASYIKASYIGAIRHLAEVIRDALTPLSATPTDKESKQCRSAVTELVTGAITNGPYGLDASVPVADDKPTDNTALVEALREADRRMDNLGLFVNSFTRQAVRNAAAALAQGQKEGD